MALERFKRKLTIENLWIYILSLLQEKPRYGYEIWSSLQERFGFRPGKVTSYLVLYRLVQEGYIILQGEKKGSLGPARKYYAITNKGKQLLKKAESFLNDIQVKVFSHESK